MKFSLAVAILAHTLPVSSKEADFHPIEWTPINSRQQRHQSIYKANRNIAPFRGYRKQPKSAVRSDDPVLRNSVFRKKECNPTSTDPDIGVLSCGQGRYCQESVQHGLGGVCAGKETAEVHRDLQAGSGGEFLQSFCNPLSDIYGVYDCDCSEFDVATGQGDIQCSTFDSYCFDPGNTTCATSSFFADFMEDDTYSVTFCYDFLLPYYERVCYNVDYFDSTCTLEFNNVTCASCTVQNDTLANGYYCLDFDCSNTAGMHDGSECDGDKVSILRDNLICSVCPGNAPVSNPGYMIGGTTCGQLQDDGLEGRIPVDDCPTAQVSVPIICGCEPAEAPLPTPPPVPAPGQEPICLVCPGDGDVINPEIIIGDTSCGDLQESGRQGQIPEENCPAIQSGVPIQCGCADVEVPTPTPAPIEVFPVCSVCPDGEPVTNPDEIVELPDQPETTCGELQESGLEGLISPELCPVVQGSVPLLCGCGAAETDPPVEPVTDAPAVQPTDAPAGGDICIICLNDDDVTNPDNIVEVPGEPDSDITCAELQALGRQGLIPPDQCIGAQVAAPFLCGCGDIELTLPPAESPPPDMSMSLSMSMSMPMSMSMSMSMPMTDSPTIEPATDSPTPAPSGEVCIICLDDNDVDNPDNIIETPDNPDISCGELQEFGRQGMIPPDQCIGAQTAAPFLCGCGFDLTLPPIEAPAMSMSMSLSMSMSMSMPLSPSPTVMPGEMVTEAPTETPDLTCIVCPGDEGVTNPGNMVGDLTCQEVQDFGRQGMIPPDQCVAAQGAIPFLCGCGVDETICIVCPDDEPVTHPDFQIGDITCGELQEFGREGLIPPERCPETQGTVPLICGCGIETEAPSMMPDMSMMMNGGSRELDALLDNEFGQDTEDEPEEDIMTPQRVRKRL